MSHEREYLLIARGPSKWVNHSTIVKSEADIRMEWNKSIKDSTKPCEQCGGKGDVRLHQGAAEWLCWNHYKVAVSF